MNGVLFLPFSGLLSSFPAIIVVIQLIFLFKALSFNTLSVNKMFSAILHNHTLKVGFPNFSYSPCLCYF